MESSRNIIYSHLDFKHIENKPIEISQNLNQNEGELLPYKEEVIIKRINESFRVNQIMEPIFLDVMTDKKEFNRLKFENDKKELRSSYLTKLIIEIEQKDNFEMMRKKLKELKEKINEEKEKIFNTKSQTHSLLYMLDVRKHDLTIQKHPVIKELQIAPKMNEKTDNEIEELNQKIKTLNQIYVIQSINIY